MSLYGVCPARNHLSLVICERCRQSVTPQGLQQHYGMLKQCISHSHSESFCLYCYL